jgi:hypothetical protein
LRVLIVLLAAGVGLVTGQSLTYNGLLPGLAPERQSTVYPLPHQIPKYPGGVALRFAMAHDVLHERFARHGKAYYTERNRRARAALATERAGGGRPSARYFALLDDLGAGLDYLGEHAEAVRVLRGKLAEQQAAGLKGRALYTTYANLGTFLIHGSFKKAQGGDAAARERLREGLALIHKSIEVNPEAHFGRELWQAVTAEFLLAAIDNPRVLLKYDLAGNRLDEEVTPGRALALRPTFLTEGAVGPEIAAHLADPKAPERGAALRRFITRVGAPAWVTEVKTSHRTAVPFDEPVLGVIGMWRLGGGANPHFALLLGETMFRVGQRHIAWCAYERAARLADRFWPDAAVQRQFVAHCRARQQAILKTLPDREREELPRRFEAELAHGQRYQEAHRKYEEERIAAGAAPADPHFYDAFHARHGKIASPPGGADDFQVARRGFVSMAGAPALFAGLFGLGAALYLRRRAREG